jgi:glycosyltransferase involved in cell wall biosynthesis
MMATPVKLSVIVPVGSRYDDVPAVLDAYRTELDRLDIGYELIYVLDGPRPDALEVLRAEQARGVALEILQLARSFGEATAIVAGFEASRGELILTLPAYFQVDPAEIRRLLEYKGDHHMLVAHRWPRSGGPFERARRFVFHGMLRLITGQTFRDLGCGVRLFDRAVLDEVSIYGDQHRFLPLLAQRNGFRVLEREMKQSTRDEFRGRYAIREYVRRSLDILTVFFLIRFTKKPLRFFGMIGTVLFGVGALGLTVVVVERLFFNTALADRPAMLLSALLVVLGVQIGALGLLGELIIFTHARSLKEYRVERIVNPAPPDSEASSVTNDKRAACAG